MTADLEPLSTVDDLVSVRVAAETLGVPELVLRVLMDADAVSTYRARRTLGDPLPRVRRAELTEPDPDVADALSNARALIQYLTGCPPVHRRPTAKATGAPLWVRRTGDVQGVAVRPRDIPPWIVTNGPPRPRCSESSLRSLFEAAGWEYRRLVVLAASDVVREDDTRRAVTNPRQVSWHSWQLPGWLAHEITLRHGPAAGSFDD